MTDRIVYEHLPLGLTVIIVFLFLGIGIIIYGNKVMIWWTKIGLRLQKAFKFRLFLEYPTETDTLNDFANSTFYKFFIFLSRIVGGIFIVVSLYGLILILINVF
jgi:hypothetical protein